MNWQKTTQRDRVRVLGTALCGVAFVACGGFRAPGSADPPQPEAALLTAARTYVRGYEDQLTLVLADEDYVQQIRDQVPLSTVQGRTMKSEMYFIAVPQTGSWIAVRDVVSVDGQPVADRPNLMTMLATIPVAQVDAFIKARNSRFNIGRTVRNFNEPTLALQILDASRESTTAFRVTGTRTDHGTAVATLTYREQGTGTLLHDLAHQPAPSTGQILVEPESGRIRRTELTTTIGRVSMKLTTDYAYQASLDLWVPSQLQEHYEEGVYGSGADSRVTGTGHEEIWCEAKYSHFHRFEVKGGIKKGTH